VAGAETWLHLATSGGILQPQMLVQGWSHRAVHGWAELTMRHSGSPALRRPSINIWGRHWPLRATHSDIRKLGSSSRNRATVLLASASRPKCARAAARHR